MTSARTPLPIICGDCGHQHTHFLTLEEWEAMKADTIAKINSRITQEDKAAGRDNAQQRGV